MKYVTLWFFTLTMATFVGHTTVAIASESPARSISESSSEVTKPPVVNGLFYLSWQSGESGGAEFSEFFIHRAYFTFRRQIKPWLSARLTIDTDQDHDGDGEGDMEVRLKYAYANFGLASLGALQNIHAEFGIVHTVWIDFMEAINLYRMREAMFMERNGILSSADFGLTLNADLGKPLPAEYREQISGKYAGRHGSLSVGIYNGGGYHAIEKNQDKVAQGRLTVRPLAGVLPGLQLSGLIIHGRGNKAGSRSQTPVWTTWSGLLSYQHRFGTLTAQIVGGEGNQSGDWASASDSTKSLGYSGWSLFGEGRINRRWRLIAGLDRFDLAESARDQYNEAFVGIGCVLTCNNILLMDFTQRRMDDSAVPNDQWIQVTLQVSF